MDPTEIERIFRQEEIGEKISCSKAFEISERYGISRTEISRHCNRNNIKICTCQLGCFK